MKKSNVFKLYRGKKLISMGDQIAVTRRARTDALKEFSEGRKENYLLVGNFNGIKEKHRMGGLTHGNRRMSWKFIPPPPTK